MCREWIGRINMIKNKVKPNLVFDNLDGDQEVAILKGRLKKANQAVIYMISSFIMLFAGIDWVLIINPAFSFAVIHNGPASKYATHFYQVEKAAKDSAKEVLDTWVATGEIK